MNKIMVVLVPESSYLSQQVCKYYVCCDVRKLRTLKEKQTFYSRLMSIKDFFTVAYRISWVFYRVATENYLCQRFTHLK